MLFLAVSGKLVGEYEKVGEIDFDRSLPNRLSLKLNPTLFGYRRVINGGGEKIYSRELLSAPLNFIAAADSLCRSMERMHQSFLGRRETSAKSFHFTQTDSP